MHSFRPTRRALTSRVALERSGHNGCWLAFGHSDREHHLLVTVSGIACLNGDVNLGDNFGDTITVAGVTKLDELGMRSVSQETPRSFAASL